MPRNRTRTTDRAKYDQALINQAVKLVRDEKKSYREVEELLGMPKSTLGEYVTAAKRGDGVVIKKRKLGRGTLFTEEEEQRIASHIRSAASLFHGVSILGARKLAYEFGSKLGKSVPDEWHDKKKAGEGWLEGFRKRHQLSLREPEATSRARVAAFNKDNVGKFFDNLREVYGRQNFSPNQVWNLDETGVMTVQKTTKVLAPKGIRHLGQLTSAERGTLVTMCCCVSASGQSLPPAYIFPRVNMKDQMLSGAPPGSLGLAAKSGWMSTEEFLKVLGHFIKGMGVTKETPHLLIMDNHRSHVSIGVIEMAESNGLTLLTLPPHCSNRMQPLDVSVYGPFKSFYNTACTDWLTQNSAKVITIYDIGMLSCRAYFRAMIPSNITSGFRATGICPLDSDIFSQDPLFIANSEAREEEGPSLSALLPPVPRLPPPSSSRRRVFSQILTRQRSASDSSSEDEAEEDPPVDDSSEGSSPQTSADEEEPPIKKGAYVVVKLSSGLQSEVFIGEVLEVNRGGSLLVSFLKRSTKGRHFLRPDEADESVVQPGEVLKVIQAPVVSGGTKRRQAMLMFNDDVDSWMKL